MKKLCISTTPERSRLMSRVRQSGTDAELSVRALLRSLGAEYETRAEDLPGRPDIVNRNRNWAIFVNGCFWHAHEGCKRWTIPKRNRSFWKRKFRQNRLRDRKRINDLKQRGFIVLVVWECELEQKEKLKRKLLRFVRRESNPPRFIEAQRLQKGAQEKYAYVGDSVARTVLLSRGQAVETRVRVGKGAGEDPHSDFDSTFLRSPVKPVTTGDGESVRVVDLFCGCGGLSLGIMEACRALHKRFAAVLAVDRDPSCMTIYRKNLLCEEAHQVDITEVIDGTIGSPPTVNERNFLKNIRDITILLAGPPCQGNSDLNNRTRRKDPRNALYERVARFVEVVEPEHILVENVAPAVHGKERAIQRTIEVLRREGYHVDSGIVDLSTIGVPQTRKRHVLVASKSKKLSLVDVIERHRVSVTRSVRWAIGDLEHELPNGPFTTPSKYSERNFRRIRYLHTKGLFELPNKLRPPCHRSGEHSYKSMYGRLKLDEPAQTITSGFGSPGQGRFVHPTQMRTLTPHEAARLQFFPDFFDFSLVKERGPLASMIGNAAPMKLSYVFALELLP